MGNVKQITGNVGLYHVARELSRVGWNAMPTVRNARGADLFASSEDERIIHPIQVKTNSGNPMDTSLGLHPGRFVTPWWVFVTQANSDAITCHILTLEEVLARAVRDPGTRSNKPESERQFWISHRFYKIGGPLEMVEARNAWHRLGNPRSGT